MSNCSAQQQHTVVPNKTTTKITVSITHPPSELRSACRHLPLCPFVITITTNLSASAYIVPRSASHVFQTEWPHHALSNPRPQDTTSRLQTYLHGIYTCLNSVPRHSVTSLTSAHHPALWLCSCCECAHYYPFHSPPLTP